MVETLVVDDLCPPAALVPASPGLVPAYPGLVPASPVPASPVLVPASPGDQGETFHWDDDLPFSFMDDDISTTDFQRSTENGERGRQIGTRVKLESLKEIEEE